MPSPSPAVNVVSPGPDAGLLGSVVGGRLLEGVVEPAGEFLAPVVVDGVGDPPWWRARLMPITEPATTATVAVPTAIRLARGRARPPDG
jgi:hypothetical protein